MKLTSLRHVAGSRFIRLTILGLTTLGAALFFFLRPAEPVYQGRALTDWLKDINDDQPEIREASSLAVRAIGTNAIPTLFRMIQSRESALEENAILQIERFTAPRGIHVPHPHERVTLAVAGFATLGATAKAAVPDLDALLQRSKVPDSVAWALAALGEEGIARVVSALTNDQKQVRLAAIHTLGYWASNATAVAALVRQLDDSDVNIRVATAISVERNESTMDNLMVPALAKGLGDSSEEVRLQCARSLGRIGPKAAMAVPLLTKLQEESSLNFRGQLRAEVDRALFQICSNTGSQSPLR